MSEFHAEAPQAIVSEALAQGPYVAAKAGFEPTTLLSRGIDSTNAEPRSTHVILQMLRNAQGVGILLFHFSCNFK